jgi:hypothetical protein
MKASPLDEFIPRPDARERFGVVIEAPTDVVWATARDYDVQSHALVQGIFRLRELLTGAAGGRRAPQGLFADMRSMGWGVLREEPGSLFMAGAVCQPWLGDVRFSPVAAGAFREYAEPERVKIAWTLEVTPVDEGRTRLVTETRAVATDGEARRRFRSYWRWARFGIIPIRWLLLPSIGKRARAEWARRGAAHTFD